MHEACTVDVWAAAGTGAGGDHADFKDHSDAVDPMA